MADFHFKYNHNGLSNDISVDGYNKKFVNDAIEGDNYNLLNDETFGDHIEDYEWEGTERRYKDPFHDDTQYGGDYIYEATRAYSPNAGDEAELRLHEDEMAFNIRRLVVEDDNNSNSVIDPAVVMSGPAIPIQKKRQNLDDLFGPASPPALYDTNFMSPSNQNIWGSPSRQTLSPNLDNLFTQAKFSNLHLTKQHVAGIGKSPCKAITLEELEQKMLASRPKTPTTISAQDLERKLRGDGPGVVGHSTPFTMPVPIPRLLGRESPLTHGGVTPKANLEAALMAQTHLIEAIGRMTPPIPHEATIPQSSTPISRVRQSPVTIGASPSPGHRGAPPHVNGSPMFPMGTVRHPYPDIMRPPPPFVPLHGLNTNILPGQVLANALRRMPSHGMPPPPFPFARGVIQPQRPLHMTFSDPTAQRDRRYNNQGYNNHSYNKNNHNYKWFRGQAPNNRYYRDNEDEAKDPYDGLMSQKEKEWVIKIQLLQLQTDNPYIDDYYYTTHTLNKARARLARENMGEGQNGEMDLLLPHMARQETREYTPAQFEGSLGRLTSASVHNPRKIIDVHRRDDEAAVSQAGESDAVLVSQKLRRFRKLLTDIENGYSLLLSIDDIEKEIPALPEETRQPLIDKRRGKIARLHAAMCRHDDDKTDHFASMMSFRKGKNLVARSLLLFSQDQTREIIELLLHNMACLIRKDGQDDACVLVSPLRAVLCHADLSTLVHYASIVQQLTGVLPSMLLNKFGASIVSLLLARAENILSELSILDIDSNTQSDWCTFIQCLSDHISSAAHNHLATPLTKFTSIVAHFDRFIDKQSLGSIEDKLGVYTGVTS